MVVANRAVPAKGAAKNDPAFTLIRSSWAVAATYKRTLRAASIPSDFSLAGGPMRGKRQFFRDPTITRITDQL